MIHIIFNNIFTVHINIIHSGRIHGNHHGIQYFIYPKIMVLMGVYVENELRI